jgi:nucleoside-diphosphate-sugar epimerase
MASKNAAGSTRRKSQARKTSKPVVLITGAAGNVGGAIIAALKSDYTLVGLDLPGKEADCETFETDLTDPSSISDSLAEIADKHSKRFAAVIHLAAFFDFSGEEHPLYEKLNIEGTRHLLRALQDYSVERFIYSGTMLVHRAGEPGLPITEETELDPQWIYPQSKADAEAVIREEAGDIPYLLFHLAGLYDEESAVPTLTEQIRRIYERDPKSHAYAGSTGIGQAMIHKDDMAAAFAAAVKKRKSLPEDAVILAGEPEAIPYDELQDRLGELIHGDDHWATVSLPKPLAKAAAWLEAKAEPVIPDSFDHGEKPFIRPFMVDMASDHYELDITKAKELLGWEPKHSLRDTLPALVKSLKSEPLGWYERNGLTPPYWLTAAAERTRKPENLRVKAERERRAKHFANLWAPFATIGLGLWLITSPAILGYESAAMGWSDGVSGVLITLLAFLTLDWRFSLVRWAVAAIGVWVMFAPLVFWAPTAAAYLNGTLVGALVFGFAGAARPAPGIDPVAATTGPTVPKGWDYTPSSWFQRIPIIVLAVVGFFVSRHLAAYQLGHIEGVWEPFFAGSATDPQNGTEEIITSSVSEAWPVSDAGVGGLTYMLEILVGLVGSARRWRTMPWLVILFGIMIVPLGIVSITFIIIQPVVIGTWATLTLIAAAAMLIQIPYSIDELVATGQFLTRRVKAGRPFLRVFLMGDTDEGADERKEDDFEQSPKAIVSDMLGGGMSTPWTLLACIAIGIWLMFTRLTLGTEGAMANADHIIGALVVTVAVTAFAEAARSARFLITVLGMALAIMPFIVGGNAIQIAADMVAGLALIGLSLPKGQVKHNYGSWSRYIV